MKYKLISEGQLIKEIANYIKWDDQDVVKMIKIETEIRKIGINESTFGFLKIIKGSGDLSEVEYLKNTIAHLIDQLCLYMTVTEILNFCLSSKIQN